MKKFKTFLNSLILNKIIIVTKKNSFLILSKTPCLTKSYSFLKNTKKLTLLNTIFTKALFPLKFSLVKAAYFFKACSLVSSVATFFNSYFIKDKKFLKLFNNQNINVLVRKQFCTFFL